MDSRLTRDEPNRSRTVTVTVYDREIHAALGSSAAQRAVLDGVVHETVTELSRSLVRTIRLNAPFRRTTGPITPRLQGKRSVRPVVVIRREPEYHLRQWKP